MQKRAGKPLKGLLKILRKLLLLSTGCAPFFVTTQAQEQFTLVKENQHPSFQFQLITDLNNDGHVDIVGVLTESEVPIALINDTNSGFTELVLAAEHQAFFVSHGDVDNDGDDDLLFLDDTDLILLRNQGNLNFEKEYIWYGQADSFDIFLGDLELADINADGFVDLIRHQFSFGFFRLSYFPNNGTGGFGTEELIYQSNGPFSHSILFDIDCDERPELVLLPLDFSNFSYYDELEIGFLNELILIDEDINSLHLIDRFDDETCSDIFGFSSVDRSIRIYKRQADGTFEDTHLKLRGTENLTTFFDFENGDVNGDGYNDFLSSGTGIFDFNFVTGIFMGSEDSELNPYQEITSTTDLCLSFLIDKDGDSDLDILQVCQLDDLKTFTSWLVNMAGLPRPNFDYLDCEGRFVNNSVAYYPNSTVSWDFGNGSFSSEIYPELVYDEPGTYTATLTICNDNGCKSLVESVVVEHVTSYDFPRVAQVGERVHFSDNSHGYTNWTWVVGTDHVSTDRNTEYIFSEPGVYDIELYVTDSQEVDCTWHFKEKITILDLGAVEESVFIYPNPSFGATEVLLPSEESWSLVITDIAGNSVQVGNFIGPRARFDTRMLKVGVYVCQLTNDTGKTITRKLVVAK